MEIGVRVQALGARRPFCGRVRYRRRSPPPDAEARGYHPWKHFEMFICKIVQSGAFLVGNATLFWMIQTNLHNAASFSSTLQNEGVNRERDCASDIHTHHATCNICRKMTEQKVSWSFYSSVAFLCVLKPFNNGNAVPTRSPSKWPLLQSPALGGFLANVLRYVRYMLSAVRLLSVCCL